VSSIIAAIEEWLMAIIARPNAGRIAANVFTFLSISASPSLDARSQAIYSLRQLAG
jgi:hypothetical protein